MIPSPVIAAALALIVGTAGPCSAADATQPAGTALAAPPMAQDSLIAGHFRLSDPDGRIVDSDTLSGQPYGIVFGFTNCPNICPTTLSDLSQAMANLPPATPLRIYFVTVDPERDTPAVLKQYLSSFDSRLVGLSGDRAAVDEAIGSFGVVARRTAFPDGQYSYSHSAAVMLVDGDGLIVDRLSAEDDAAVLAKRLAAFVSPRLSAR